MHKSKNSCFSYKKLSFLPLTALNNFLKIVLEALEKGS